MFGRTFALLITLALALAPPGEAWAGKKADKEASKGTDDQASPWKNVEPLGLKSIDDVFAPIQSMHDTLSSAEGSMAAANTNLATALALPAGTPLADAITELNTRANGKIAVALEGTVPKLSAKDAVPSDVQAGIDALNGLTSSVGATVTAIGQIPSQVQAVIPQISKLPQTFPAEAKTLGAKITEIPKMLVTLKNNVDATLQTPERAAALLEQITSTFGLLTSSFGGATSGSASTTAGPVRVTPSNGKSQPKPTDTPGATKVRPK